MTAVTGREPGWGVPESLAVTVTVGELRRLPADRTRAYLLARAARDARTRGATEAARAEAVELASTRLAGDPRSATAVVAHDGQLGARLRSITASQGMTLRDLGRVAGVYENGLYRLVNHPRSAPTAGALARIAAALGTTPAYLAGGAPS